MRLLLVAKYLFCADAHKDAKVKSSVPIHTFLPIKKYKNSTENTGEELASFTDYVF